MQGYLCRIGVVVVALALVPVAEASSFAVLLDAGSAGQGEALTISNPLYQPGATQGESVLYSERVQSITLDLNQIWLAAGEDALLTVLTGGDIPPTGNQSLARDAGYFGFSVAMTSVSSGQPITDLLFDVEFQFTIPAVKPDPVGGLPDTLAGGVLGFYNEQTMMWEAEDVDPGSPPGGGCAGNNDKVCGTTNHFTVFVLGDPVNLPEPGTLGLLGVGALGLMRGRGGR